MQMLRCSSARLRKLMPATMIAIASILAGCQVNTAPTPAITVEIVKRTPAVNSGAKTATAPAATPVSTATSMPTATPRPAKTVWIDPVLPSDLHDALVESVKQLGMNAAQANPGVKLSPSQPADIVIDSHAPSSNSDDVALISRTYAIAAPFPTIADSITLDALTSFWQGDVNSLSSLTNDGSKPTLYTDAATRAGLVLLLGKPSDAAPIRLVRASELVTATWAARPGSFAILPFDNLGPQWKLIWLNGLNLFEKQMDAGKYPLTLYIHAHVVNPDDTALASRLPTSSNRDVSKLAVVAMTGTTAMVRGTAVQMERKGITYPGEAIRDWLLTADVRHISNEVSFWDNCPYPTFNDGVSMCSNPKYIDLLKYVGANLIELSGNHLWDKGTQYLSTTIQMYDDLGWKYFAGGRTYTESQRPVTMTVAGNRLAFVGCNWFGADWATPANGLPGSSLCGADDPHSLDLITPTIKSLTEQGYLVIATFQYQEYYTYEPNPQQERDFMALRDAGAVVVNGSQGHWVQGFNVTAAGFIHYGVGNLFFGDQEGIGTHQTFVDRHVFYAGKYLGADLRTAFIVDYSKPEPMNSTDRAKLLKTLFAASGY